ncbi:hypothetical protein ACOMHN_063150 [Nucella lapillus]
MPMSLSCMSVGTTCAKKRTAIQEFIMDNDVDIMELTETLLRETGDEAKCVDITPPDYTMYSFFSDLPVIEPSVVVALPFLSVTVWPRSVPLTLCSPSPMYPLKLCI